MEDLKNNPTDTPKPRPTLHEQPPKRSKKKIVLISAAVLVVAVAALLFVFLAKSKQSSPPSNNQPAQDQTQSTFMQQYGNGCKQRDVTFSSSPMKLEELAYIRPLGAVSDGHVTPTDHVYIGGPNPNAPDNTYAVLMPADGTVSTVSAMPAEYIGDRQGQQVAPDDHRVVVSHSCRYFSIFIHIHKLSDKLTAVVGDLQPNENKQADVELKAGEVIGYIGGSTFDWTPIDTSVTLKGFTTPSLYEGEPWKIHTVSPFDLYTGELKAKLEAKSLRTEAPLGGKIDYDMPGKLIGNWFREGSGGYTGASGNNGGRYWDGHLSIAPDYVDPASTIVSIGNWKDSARQFVVKGTNNHPAAVGEGEGIVKYELLSLTYETPGNPRADARIPTKGIRPSQNGTFEGTLLVQVLPGEKLKIEKFPGKAATQVNGFTSGAWLYER